MASSNVAASTSASTSQQQPPKRKSRKPAGPPAWPLYSFDERQDGVAGPGAEMYYVRNPEDADMLVQRLRGPIGFDLEWKPQFQKGQLPNRTAVVQLADQNHAFVIQVSAMQYFPEGVKALLEDPDVVKLGVNIREDALKLYHDYGVACHHLIDLSTFAHLVEATRWAEKSNLGLAVLCESYLQRSLPKGSVRTSNWEAVLTAHQQFYAANDAHCAVSIYTRLAIIEERMDKPPKRHAYVVNVDERLLRDVEERRKKAEIARQIRRDREEQKEREKAEGKPAEGETQSNGVPSEIAAAPSPATHPPEAHIGSRGRDRGRGGGAGTPLFQAAFPDATGRPLVFGPAIQQQNVFRGRGSGWGGRGWGTGQERGGRSRGRGGRGMPIDDRDVQRA